MSLEIAFLAPSPSILKGSQFECHQDEQGQYLLPQIQFRPSSFVAVTELSIQVLEKGFPMRTFESAWSEALQKLYQGTRPSRAVPSRLQQITRPWPSRPAFAPPEGSESFHERSFAFRVQAIYALIDAAGQVVFETEQRIQAVLEMTFFQRSSKKAPPSKVEEIPETPVHESPKGEEPSESPSPLRGDKGFPFWFALDFGTTNSTITLFDAKKVYPSEGLPEDQVQYLRRQCLEWFQQTPDAAGELHAQAVSEWKQLLQGLSLQEEGLVGTLMQAEQKTLHEVLRRLEQQLGSSSPEVKRYAYRKLHQIYTSTMRIPPFRQLQLFPVEMDQATGEKEIQSLSQIESLEPLRMVMGKGVKLAQEQALVEGREVHKEFVASPKHYLGKQTAVEIECRGQRMEVTAQKLLRSAWEHLIHRVEDFRDREAQQFSEGAFRQAVVTYPAVTPPAVRKQIEETFRAMGFEWVKTTYDEAVSVAIFYLMREAGGEMGKWLDALKSRCRNQGGRWFQNIMVFDIGGGTTDIALIQLTMREEDPFSPGEDRGAGGKFYVLEPRLLGSSGHAQLGGNLVTLKTFHLLKATIADALVRLASVSPQGEATSRLLSLLEAFGAPFVTARGYSEGALIKHSLSEKDAFYGKAKEAVEAILPTRWKGQEKADRVQTFYTLWSHAEAAKVHLGKRREEGQLDTEYEIPAEDVHGLLLRAGFQLPKNEALRVGISRSAFEKVVTPVIVEGVKIAKDLLNSRLKEETSRLDWLILSGKTCNLALVDQEFRKALQDVQAFAWNPERVTFEQEYSKLATSIGACYAEYLWQFGFAVEGAKQALREGKNQVQIDIKNLYFFLSSTFKRKLVGYDEVVFEVGQELRQLDTQEMGKARSGWMAASLMTTIIRQDANEEGSANAWCHFGAAKTAEMLRLSEEEWKKKILYQFEINQQNDFRLFVCQGEAAYQIPQVEGQGRLSCASVLSSPLLPKPGNATMPGNPTPTPSKERLAPPTDAAHLIVSGGGTAMRTTRSQEEESAKTSALPCDLALQVLRPGFLPRPEDAEILFKAGTAFSKRFFVETKEGEGKKGTEARQGMISAPIREFPNNQQHEIYARYPGEQAWVRVGALKKPSVSSKFPQQYYVTLDEKGEMVLHVGEVPYRWAKTAQEVLEKPGSVYALEMESAAAEIKEERDPFSGVH